MIAALVLFQNDGALSLDDAASRFNTTAPNYRGRAGLHSKAYIYAEDGSTLGGFYIFDSHADADALYTDAWRARATELYGVEPIVRSQDSFGQFAYQADEFALHGCMQFQKFHNTIVCHTVNLPSSGGRAVCGWIAGLH